MAGTLKAEELREKGNAAYMKKDYQRALQLYSKSLELDKSNHLVWGNRSAVKNVLNDYDGALLDAQQAIELLPTWSKGYVRKAIGLVGKGRSFEAIEAYESALLLDNSNQTVRDRVTELKEKFYRPKYSTRTVRSLEIETNIETCHRDVALAFAAGRDIPLSASPSISTVRAAIVDHAQRHPAWDAPKRRYLFIPCAGENKGSTGETAAAPRNVEFDPSLGEIRAPTYKLLGCQFVDSEVLYSEDAAEMMRGNRNGVGIGYIYRTWEFIMDDNCVATRPLNELASRLLHRPKTYGPVLVLRATHLKSSHNLVQLLDDAADTIAWEILPIDELETEEWRVKRAEWKELLQRNRDTEVGKRFGTSAASTTLECMLKELEGVDIVHV